MGSMARPFANISEMKYVPDLGIVVMRRPGTRVAEMRLCKSVLPVVGRERGQARGQGLCLDGNQVEAALQLGIFRPQRGPLAFEGLRRLRAGRDTIACTRMTVGQRLELGGQHPDALAQGLQLRP